MHEPLEGIADADARPRPAVPAPGCARCRSPAGSTCVQVGEHGAEVAWNLDDTRAGAPGRLALYAGAAPAPERDLPDAQRGRGRGRDRRAHGRAGRSAAVAAPGDRAALAARRPAPAPDGAGAVGARAPCCAGAFGVGSRARVGAAPASQRGTSGWPAARCWPSSVFLPWYGTDPDNRFASDRRRPRHPVAAGRCTRSCAGCLLAASVAPFILAYIIAADASCRGRAAR